MDIAPYLEPVAALRGRALVLAQRTAASQALFAAATRAGAPGTFARDEAGAPIPTEGWWWSTAHTAGLAAAAVAPVRIGIDVERLNRPRLAAARTKYADELAQLGRDDAAAVLSLWCAKEALVKRSGVGVADLPHCTLLGVSGCVWSMRYHQSIERVTVLISGEHVVAVAAGDRDVAALESTQYNEVLA